MKMQMPDFRPSLATKWLAFQIVGLGCILILVGVFQYRSIRQTIYKDVEDSGQAVSQAIKEMLVERPELFSRETLGPVLLRFSAKIPNIRRVSIIDQTRHIIADSDFKSVGKLTDESKLISLLEGAGESRSFFERGGREYLRLSYSIEGKYDPIRKSNIVGAMSMDLELANTEQRIAAAFMQTMWVVAGFLFLFWAIQYAFMRHGFLRWLRLLTATAERFGKGDFSARAQVETSDELGQLARSFNIMAENLQSTTVSKDYVNGIIRSMSDSLVVTSPDGCILTVNVATCRLLGYSEGELIGQPLQMLFGAESALALDMSTGVGPVHDVERVYSTRNGQKIPVSFSSAALQSANGQAQGVVCVAKDISERKNAEATLAKSEKRYRDLVDNGLGLICTHDLDGKLLSVNPAAAGALGYTPVEMVGRNLIEYISPSGQPAFPHYLARIAAEPNLSGLMNLLTRKGDERIWMYRNARIEEGMGAYVLGYAQDVTEQKQIETELRQRDLELVEAQHIALMGNWDWDVATNKTNWSDALYHTYGIQPQDCPPTYEGYLSLVHPDDRKNVSELVETVLQSGQGCSYGHRIIWPDQSVRFLHVNLKVDLDEAGHPVRLFGTAQDVTDRVLMEEELKEARDAAVESARLKSEFLANMSHEIRTPMNGIMGMTELALDTELTSQQREYLDIVRSSTVSLLTIINDILDFSKIEAGKLELDSLDFDLPETVADTTRTLALRAHEKGLELAWQISADVPEMVTGDAGRLRQVLLNLIGNSVKFTERGEVIVRINRESETDNDVLVHFSISDTGIGIPVDRQQLIFHAFAQADGSTTRKYGGTGLGLPICSQLIEMMGGRIWVESEAGKGSTFHFTARFASQSESKNKQPDDEPVDFYGLRVLVVDDNATNRRILEEILRRWKMKPVLVDSGPGALAALKQEREDRRPFSLVLLDSCMPEMDGFAVAQQIRNLKEAQGATIMMLTSSEQNISTKRLRELGIAHYLVKPISQPDLFDAIQRVLQPSTIPFEIQTAQPAKTASRPALRFLLAEDNEVNQKVVSRLLEKRGHSVVVASNGQKALDAIRADEFDVVLMDVQMPVMNGLEATRAIRQNEQENGGHLPIVAMTALAMTGDRERCLAAGMDAYLSKPVQFEELVKTIDLVTIKVSMPRESEDDARPILAQSAQVVDRDAVLARFDGDEELTREVIDILQKEIPDQLAVMRNALECHDAETLDFAAHRLKGSVGVFGEGTAFQTAERLEQMARVGDLTNARELLATLENDLKQLGKELQVLALGRSFA